MSQRFTKEQQSAIKAFQKAYDRFEKLGLLAHAAVDGLYVIRQKDWEAYTDETEKGSISASEGLNWIDFNDLPIVSVGYIEGVGD